MSDTRCNGWTNYETWRINLELCDDICANLIGEETFDSIESLAAYLEETVDEAITGYGMFEDSLAVSYARAFTNDVDWYEIAEHNADELVRKEEEAIA